MVPSIWRASLLSSAILLLHAAAAVRGEVITTPTGLKYEDENPTSCDRPTQKGDLISVHYIGTLENGKEFDQSYKRGAPFAFRLGMHQVISGWDEGLENMCIGVKRKLIIPPELGYGSRDMGDIPPNSVLIFETQLMHIKGVPDPPPPTPPPANVTEPAKAEPADKDEAIPIDAKPAETAAAAPKETQAATTGADKDTPMTTTIEESKGECRLLGPFALLVQSALGVLALLSLVFKRWRERPRRPLKIWFFDVSKQVVGTALLHVANLAMSMLSSGIDAAAHAAKIAEASKGEGEELPNPCSFYLLNLAIDTTIGIPILVVLLKLLHALFLRTPLANPPESLKSGHYGSPPRVTWWMKQCIVYFIGLFGMKLFVLFMFQALPWLPWVGDWALRWTEGNESVQIAFVMFLFPLAMNAIQYYIIDTFIKEKPEQGYESVQQDEGDADGNVARGRVVDDDEVDDGKSTPTVTTGESSGSDAGSVPSSSRAKLARSET